MAVVRWGWLVGAAIRRRGDIIVISKSSAESIETVFSVRYETVEGVGIYQVPVR